MDTIAECSYNQLLGLDLETLRVRCLEQTKAIRAQGSSSYWSVQDYAKNVERRLEQQQRENEHLKQRVAELEQYVLKLEATKSREELEAANK